MQVKNTLVTVDKILAAAEAVIKRDGVARLTLEAVASEAQVSKGGLLYHFPNKEALIVGMMQKMLVGFEIDIDHFLAGETENKGRWTRSYIKASLTPPGSATEKQKEVDVGVALIAALAVNPELLQPFREKMRSWQQMLETDDLKSERAIIAALAADCVWLYELLGLWQPSPELRRRLLEEMLLLTRDD